MLHVIVDANLVWIYKLFPRVLSLELPCSLHLCVDAAVAFFVGVRNSVLCFSLDLLESSNVDICGGRLPLKALQDVVGAVDVGLSLIVLLIDLILGLEAHGSGALALVTALVDPF